MTLLAPTEIGEAATALRIRHAGRRVLLAEDNPVNLAIAEAMLQMAGLEVTCAHDGAQAVGLACSGSFDLVFMDMQMPVMGGLEAARRIRAEAGAVLPIVAMTANACDDDRRACIDAGMNDHLAKPVEPARLFASLDRWLGPAASPVIQER